MRLSILLFTFFTSSLIAQNIDIDLVKLNTELSSIINNHRKSKKLNNLEKTDVLEKAAFDQAEYISSKQKLTHEQNLANKKNVFDRVKLYNGKFSTVGENLLSIPIFPKKYSDQEIESLAYRMFTQWKNSSGHYQNIINSEFDSGGIQFKIDTKNKKIFAVQVFGTKGVEIPNQLSNNNFNLKEKNNSCKNLNFSTKLTIGNSIQIEGSDVILYYHDKEEFKSIFTNPNDGIAIDFIEKEQMKCGVPNTFDVSPIYDGVLGKPIYIKELLEQNTAENPYKLITKVGTIPSHLIGKDLVVNIVLIFDNCACEYVIPNKVNSKTIDLFPLIPKLVIPNKILSNKGIIYSDEIEFEFDKNKIIQKNNGYYSLYNDVHSIQIYSYSSVEGNEIINNKLHQDRAKTIEKFAKDSLRIKIKPSLILAKENWEKCLLQLAMENNDEMLTKPRNEIRKYINENSKEWNNYLNQQRVSKLVINYQGEITNDNSFNSNEEYDVNYYELNLRSGVFEKDIDKINLSLAKLYEVETSRAIFEEFIFNEINSNSKLVQNYAAVLSKNFTLNREKTVVFLDTWLSKFNELNKDAQFNLLNLYCKTNRNLLEYWDINITKLANVIKPYKHENKFTFFKENKGLQSNFDYILLYYSSHINDYEKVNTYFDKVYNSFKANIKNTDDRINLALFLNHWSAFGYSIELLKSQINNPKFSKEEALLLAQTATVIFDKNNNLENQKIINKVYKLNKTEWCKWQKENFNLLRNSYIKDQYCKFCNDN
ncbi:MAG: CAP domain-containing protein [Flavobacterium sp.]|nr:CAP domain-containing protein [Flavobacterium sp.]